MAQGNGSIANDDGVRITSLLNQQPLHVMMQANEEQPHLLDLIDFRRVKSGRQRPASLSRGRGCG